MSNDKLRRQITYEAARMLCVRQESDYYRAKMKAARRICQGWVHRHDLPSDREIREEIQALARMHEGNVRVDDVPSVSPSSFHPAPRVDRFELYQTLLLPLETVKQDPRWHPEGDALYHSLQVFVRAREALPYDEEFQTAALLHDVGKAIDPRQRVAAALEELNGYISERTAWFIQHHMEADQLRDGELGARARRRLEAHEDFEDLMLLCDCDRAGRECGVEVPEVEEAIEHLRELAQGDESRADV
jgi:hypothetical protein